MSSSKQLDIHFEDPNPKKWCHPLKEDGFAAFMSREQNSSTIPQKIFGGGSFFSPMLFGKFFDPSDAFPLWEFNPDELLPNVHNGPGAQRSVDWFNTESEYVVRAEIPAAGLGNTGALQVSIENGKILEINGQWRQQQKEPKAKDWKSSHWWEHGYVRRLELPEHTDWRKAEAHVKNDAILEIKLPKTTPHPDITS